MDGCDYMASVADAISKVRVIILRFNRLVSIKSAVTYSPVITLAGRLRICYSALHRLWLRSVRRLVCVEVCESISCIIKCKMLGIYILSPFHRRICYKMSNNKATLRLRFFSSSSSMQHFATGGDLGHLTDNNVPGTNDHAS